VRRDDTLPSLADRRPPCQDARLTERRNAEFPRAERPSTDALDPARVVRPAPHATTNVDVIGRFLPVAFEISGEPGHRCVAVLPR